MDVETDPLAVYVVIEYGPQIRVHGPFAFRQLADQWAARHRTYVCPVYKLRPVLDDAATEPVA